ncbi:MAG: hypothetical protein RBG13Loki_0331 [Promethearchaeota archaeon CR_4]|nr:MAG: hypothetical protein RBG13Loki_0331 [Candidatus Lokiarchaeota archaeon CR_4]
MPKSNPKHRYDPNNSPRIRLKYPNWRWIKRVAIGATVIGIVVGLVAWSAVATWPDVREGDTVRVSYEIRAADGTWIEGSDDLTVYVDASRAPTALHSAIAHAKLNVPRTFAVSACPTHDCPNFGGYTTGPYAWQGIQGSVTVLEVLNR